MTAFLSWSFTSVTLSAVASCISIILLFAWLPQHNWCRRWRWRMIPLRRSCCPPGPPAWPIIGHMHLLAGGAPHLSLAKLAQTYGPLICIRLGSMPTLVVSSPDLAREFLFTHDRVFASRPYFGCAARLKGGQDAGLAMARYGPAWSELRKISHTQLFTANRVKAALPIIMEEIESLMAEVGQYAMAGTAYNITKGTSVLMENIICRLLMGQRLKEVCNQELGFSLKEKVQEGIALFSTRPMIGDFIPWLGFLDLLHKRRIDAYIASLHALLHPVMAKCRRSSPPAAGQPGDHLLDSLLLASKDPDNIKTILVDFLAGGVDTPSVTLDWAMAELLLHPMIMRKLEEEVSKVVGSVSLQTLVLDEHLPHLIYTKAVVKETLRLHTPVPLLVPHMSIEDCEVEGYSIPQGTTLFVNVWAIGRDPNVWEKPLEFFPDRFLDTCEGVDLRGKHFELLPFGSGRRICPGVSLALPIVEIALANLVNTFHWCLPPTSHGEVDMSTKLGSVLCRVSPLMAIPSVKA